jgi:2-iminobutanoate/2-iminopropanoate deaminase
MLGGGAVGEVIRTDASPVPSGSYAQGVIANGLLFVAGVGPYDPATRAVVGATVEEQTVQVMHNIGAILHAAGLGFDDVVNSTVWLADLHRDWAAFDATYATYFSAGYPARAAVGAVLKNILVEIAVIAAVPQSRPAGYRDV